jgi:hypothetical protein
LGSFFPNAISAADFHIDRLFQIGDFTDLQNPNFQIIRPRPIEAPTKAPTLPRATMSIPYIEIPHRVAALPFITIKPPFWLASPSIMKVPDIMFAATRDPAGPDRFTVACLLIPAQ